MSKKKIAFVLPTLASGGAERVIITLMNGLDRARFKPHFIVVNPQGELKSLIAPDIDFISLNKTKVTKSIIELIKTLRRTKPDIVISTMLHMNVATLAAKPFVPKAKFIIREAIVPSYFFGATPYSVQVKFFYKFIYPFADIILSPAQKIIDEFSELLGQKKSRHTLLYNPVDTDKIRQIQPVSVESSRPVHFVCSGRLHPQKGFDRLIERLHELPPTMTWTLKIFGEGQERESLQSLIHSKNLQSRVTLAGLSPFPWTDIAQADAFLLPSRWEGLPNVALEALAVGTPVIAMTDAGGITEIAALSQPGQVTVTATIDQFLQAMSQIHPSAFIAPRPSLLPKDFEKRTIAAKFEKILDSL